MRQFSGKQLFSFAVVALIILSFIVEPFIALADVSMTVEPDETGSGISPVSVQVDVPFSVVDSWSTRGSFRFPSTIKKFSTTQMKALQIFLMSRGYDTQPAGNFGPKTRDALTEYQDGEVTKLLPETAEAIDDLFAYFYCPTKQQAAADFRLDNVNRPYILPEKYVPSNLILDTGDIPSLSRVCLEQETYQKFLQMYGAAYKEGVQLYVTSSYRGEESQTYLLQIMKRKLGSVAYRIVATPGQSEHNLGTAMDIGGAEGSSMAGGNAQVYAWLQKNAGLYGFVNSYPSGKESVTGFRAEPWHWRYVGAPVANQVAASGLTLGQFLDTFQSALRTVKNAVNGGTSSLLGNLNIGG